MLHRSGVNYFNTFQVCGANSNVSLINAKAIKVDYVCMHEKLLYYFNLTTHFL